MGNGPESRILGGVFGLESPCEGGESSRPPFLGRNTQYFLSVRCALIALIEARKPRSAWLPAYLCGTILTPFLQSKVAIRFYEIDDSLDVAETSWINQIQPGDLVLAIHYFGFPNPSFPSDQVTSRGAFLIEDASQALFLGQQFPESTCILYSPRKFLGVPDAGVMVSEGETGTESAELTAPPLEWWRSAVEMSLGRRDFDLTGQPNNWFAQFQNVESEFPIGLFRASDLSRMLLSAVDYAAIRARRRANYAELLELLGEYAVFPELGPDVVPLGFPVRVNPGIRDYVLRHLHSVKIYSPMHWPVAGFLPPGFLGSRQQSLSLMTLLCDQRCSRGDMRRQAAEFLASVSAARELSREKQLSG